MGMFDTVILPGELAQHFPEPLNDGNRYELQTKDIESLMWTFCLVLNEGKLELHYKSNWTSETEIYKWTGFAFLYGYTKTSNEFIDIGIKVIDGIVLEMARIDLNTHPWYDDKCSLIKKDGEYQEMRHDEEESVRVYLHDKYGISPRIFQSASELLMSLEGRMCLNPDLKWLFDKSVDTEVK